MCERERLRRGVGRSSSVFQRPVFYLPRQVGHVEPFLHENLLRSCNPITFAYTHLQAWLYRKNSQKMLNQIKYTVGSAKYERSATLANTPWLHVHQIYFKLVKDGLFQLDFESKYTHTCRNQKKTKYNPTKPPLDCFKS